MDKGEHGSIVGNSGLSLRAGAGSDPDPFVSIVPAAMLSQPFSEIPEVSPHSFLERFVGSRIPAVVASVFKDQHQPGHVAGS